MTEGTLIYEGRGKRVYQADEHGRRRVVFTDSGAPYDGQERSSFDSRGKLRNHINSVLMNAVEEGGIPTNFIRPESGDKTTVGALDIFPMEVVCYNAASGSFARRIGLSDGETMPFPVVQFYLDGKGPMGLPVKAMRLNKSAFISEGDVKVIQSSALIVNRIIKDLLYGRGFLLAEMRLEFGRDGAGMVRLGDEISPDTCRIWSRADHEKLDRDRFRKEVAASEKYYRELAQALTE